ncbi:hypothetical protein RI367_008847, partial [Sorochytrium milnesiophthora]
MAFLSLSLQIDIRIDSDTIISARTLSDSGATDSFIDSDFASVHSIPLVDLPPSLSL